MKKKSRSRKSPDTTHAWTQRLIELWKRVWHGNKSEMGRSLGVSNQVIMRILSGQQLPTGKVLEAIAAHAEINMRWLFTGEGEPLIEPGAQSGAGQFRPIVDDLLPGSPNDHRDCFTGVSFPVTEGFDSPTSYWYRFPDASPVSHEEPVQSGDLLLMETDTRWTRNGDLLAGKYIGILQRTKNGNRVLLGKVDVLSDGESYFDDTIPERYKVNTFGKFETGWLVVPSLVPTGNKQKPSALREPRPEYISAETSSDNKSLTLGLENIVCVCLQLVRGFHRKRFGRA
jgi:hypothetical protein